MITIDRNKLKAAARFAADSKDPRLSLRGVLVEASPAGVRLVATEGHAMLVVRATGEPDTDTWTGIIPSDVIKAALAWKGNKTLPIILVPGEPECRLTWALGEALVFVPVAGPPDVLDLLSDMALAGDHLDTSIALALVPFAEDKAGALLDAAPDGTVSFFDPDLLTRFKRAAEDLGSVFDLLSGGDRAGLVYLGAAAVGVIMPMRAGAIDVDFCQWVAA